MSREEKEVWEQANQRILHYNISDGGEKKGHKKHKQVLFEL